MISSIVCREDENGTHFNLDESSICTMLDEIADGLGSPQNGSTSTETQSQCTDDGALTRSVGSNDYVETGARKELAVIVGDKLA